MFESLECCNIKKQNKCSKGNSKKSYFYLFYSEMLGNVKSMTWMRKNIYLLGLGLIWRISFVWQWFHKIKFIGQSLKRKWNDTFEQNNFNLKMSLEYGKWFTVE